MTSILLSRRLTQVLQLLANGRCPKEIATDLNLATDTVRAHMFRARIRTKSRTTEEAVAWAIGQGIIKPPLHQS